MHNPIIYKFFKDFTNYRKKTNRAVVLSCRPFLKFLNTGTTDETFQQSGKQDYFRHVLKSSASMHESSGSQFFRTTTGIKSGPDAFDESRFIMTLLTILEATGILCSFKILAYTSLAASRTLLQQLLAYLNFTLDSEDLFCWYKRKKMISMNYGSSTSS